MVGGTPHPLPVVWAHKDPNGPEIVLTEGGEVQKEMVRPEGVEPPTYWFVASCSIQLSYGRTLRGMQPFKDNGIWALEQPGEALEKGGAPGRIRTSDPLVRSQMLYPAELRARESGEVR